MAKHSLKAVLLAGVLLAVATGCATSPSTYATVNGERISVSDYEKIADSVRQVYIDEGAPESQLPPKSEVGHILIIGTILEQRLEKQGKLPSAVEKSQALQKNGVAAIAKHDEYSRAFSDKLVYLFLVPSDEAKKWLSEAHVDLNPRFGTWVPGESLNARSSSLSQAPEHDNA